MSARGAGPPRGTPRAGAIGTYVELRDVHRRQARSPAVCRARWSWAKAGGAGSTSLGSTNAGYLVRPRGGGGRFPDAGGPRAQVRPRKLLRFLRMTRAVCPACRDGGRTVTSPHGQFMRAWCRFTGYWGPISFTKRGTRFAVEGLMETQRHEVSAFLGAGVAMSAPGSIRTAFYPPGAHRPGGTGPVRRKGPGGGLFRKRWAAYRQQGHEPRRRDRKVLEDRPGQHPKLRTGFTRGGPTSSPPAADDGCAAAQRLSRPVSVAALQGSPAPPFPGAVALGLAAQARAEARRVLDANGAAGGDGGRRGAGRGDLGRHAGDT